MAGQRIKTLMMAVSLCLCRFSGAAAGDSSLGGTFLPLGWDARGEGLAGAATLLSRDDAAAYWNPANLVFLDGPRMTLGSMKPVPGLDNRYSILSIGTGLMDRRISPWKDVSVSRFGAALSLSHLGLTLAGGSEWSESTLGLSLAFSPNHFNSFGATWRLMKGWTDLEDAGSWGMAFDLGWTARLHRRIWMGIVARNLSAAVHYPDSEYEMEPTLNMALSVERILGRISTELDLVYREKEINRILAGTEIIILDGTLYGIAGIDRRLVNGPRTISHFGIDARYRSADIALSFGFDPYDVFGRRTIVSMGYKF